MTKATDFYGSPFLKGSDLPRPVRVQITEYQVGEFKDQKSGQDQQRIILSFRGAKKQLVLNKTQAATLIAAYGDEVEAWIGKWVILSPGTAPNGQPTIVLAAIPQETSTNDNDNPFA